MRPIVLNEVEEPSIEYLSPNTAPVGELSPKGIDASKDVMVKEARRAAEAHRRSRYRIQNRIRPGMSLRSIVDLIEEGTREMLKGEKNNGIGFPTGVSLNDCAAHYTVNPGDPEILIKEDDVLKIDFGTHVNGWIMDSAFTVCFDPKYEQLLKASQEATECGIKCIGVDARVCDIGAEIEEVIRSFELVVGGKTYPIKPVENLNGHSIDQYKIHAGITVPIVKNYDTTLVKAGTFYAVETFATTGKGYVQNGRGCSHFILDRSVKKQLQNLKTKKVLSSIVKDIGTLPFCARYVDYIMKNEATCKPTLDILSGLRFLDPYPPLMDSKNSLVAQFEHTVFLGEFGKEVLTRGCDY